MRRAVLADTDGVVGEDVDDRQLHQRREPQGAALEVGEDQEPRLIGPDLAERQPVRDCASGVFAYAEVQVPTRPVVWLEVTGTLEGETRLVGWREIGGTADQPGHPLGGDV